MKRTAKKEATTSSKKSSEKAKRRSTCPADGDLMSLLTGSIPEAKATAVRSLGLELEVGEDETIAEEVRSTALRFLTALSGKRKDALQRERLMAQGLAEDSDDQRASNSAAEDGPKKKNVKKSKKSKEELQAESLRNFEHQQRVERRRERAAAKALAAAEAEERERQLCEKRRRQKGKLFTDNEDMWED